jgi:hypothetical protein
MQIPDKGLRGSRKEVRFRKLNENEEPLPYELYLKEVEGTERLNFIIQDTENPGEYIDYQIVPSTSNGSQGPQGTQGSQGSPGTGTQGFQGVQGATGNVGTQGQQGPTGYQGPTGANGSQGEIGSQGAIGAQGSQGTQGAEGPVGNTGAQGFQGTQGTQGFQGSGVQGAQGTQGVQGATGSSGGSGTIVLKQLIDQSSSDNTTWISSTYLTTSALTVGIRYYYKAFLFCSADVADDMNILYAGNLVDLPSALDNHVTGVAGDLFYRRDSDGITYRSLNFATGGAGMMISEGIFELSSGTSFTVRFRKNTDSTAIDSKLLRGSYLEITEIG